MSDNFASAVKKYFEIVDNINNYNLLKLINIEVVDYTETEKKINFRKEEFSDENFLINQKYTLIQGQNEIIKIAKFKLKINDTLSNEIEFKMNIIQPEIIQQEYIGNLTNKDFTDLVAANYSKLIDALKTQNIVAFSSVVNISGNDQLKDILSIQNFDYKINNLISYELISGIEEGQFYDFVTVGKLNLQHKNCNTVSSIKIIYNKISKEYKFSEVYTAFEGLCEHSTPSVASINTINLTCTDCWLAPISKIYALPSTYVPPVLATNLPGGGLLISQAKDQLKLLFDDAASKGVNMVIASAYRSYAAQEATFESWVSKEMAKGYSRAEAEIRANAYSARPGHSEHQLGSVVDLACPGCIACDYSAGNQVVYNYLEQNAYKFGFVISYPPNMQDITGYVYEPWHIRYIGIDLATELHNTGYESGNGNWTGSFLLDKGLY